jgi:hypothetical protein
MVTRKTGCLTGGTCSLNGIPPRGVASVSAPQETAGELALWWQYDHAKDGLATLDGARTSSRLAPGRRARGAGREANQ